MTPHDLEHDLLDLIEGRLSPARVPHVKAALAADPALARTVEAMIEDRRRVIDLSRATDQACRADRAGAQEMIRLALARAERDALLAHESEPAPLVAGETGKPAHARRPALLLAAAACILAAALLSLIFFRAVPNTRKAPRVAASPGPEQPAGVMVPPPAPTRAQADVPPAVGVLPAWISEVRDPLAETALKAWSADLEKSAEEPGQRPDPRALAERVRQRVVASGDRRLTLDEAAALALTDHLTLAVRAPALERASRLDAEILARAGEPPPAAPEPQAGGRSPGGLTFVVSAPLDPDLAALRDALDSLRARFAGPTGEDAWFELSPSPWEGVGGRDIHSEGKRGRNDQPRARATGFTSSVLPSLRLRDILWWSNRPDTWTRAVSIRIPVRPAD